MDMFKTRRGTRQCSVFQQVMQFIQAPTVYNRRRAKVVQTTALTRPFTETTYSTIDCSHLAKLTHCICMYVNEKAATGRRVGTSETAVTSLLTSRKKKIARRELSVQAMTQETTTWAACECRAQALNTHTNTQKEIIWNGSTVISRLQKKQTVLDQARIEARPTAYRP